MKPIGNRLSEALAHFLHAFHLFSTKQKALFLVAIAVFIFAGAGILRTLNSSITVLIPARGGSFSEGVLGIPRFINPLLALSDTDRDLSVLIYAGLMRIGSDGTPVHDLAQSHEISDDGLTYTFKLRDATWHDGKELTAEDVVFTIEKAQNPAIKSPKRASWEGVVATAEDEKTVVFTLKHPYGGFLENTTLGILPKHIWQEVDVESFPFHEANTLPIGAGPYLVDDIGKDDSSVPTHYTLRSFKNYALGEPYIRSITLRFYPNQDALENAHETGAVQSIAAIAPKSAARLEEKGRTVLRSSSPLPRIFAVFFNQNENKIFVDKAVREALAVGIDRKEIIGEVLSGYAEPITGPLPPGVIGATSTKEKDVMHPIDDAKVVLEKGGWSFDAEAGMYKKTTRANGTQWLEFSIATVNTPELKAVAEAIRQNWQTLGAKVSLNIFEIGDLNQEVIRPRKYDSLFFGEIVGRDPDPFAFWHSGERNDPGLNVALYANSAVDRLLEEAREETDKEIRREKLSEFEELIQEDVPAAFVYAPYFLYAAPAHVHGITLGGIAAGSDRFLSVRHWYIEQDRVWKIFAPKTETN